MKALTITYETEHQLQPLLQSAIENELKLLEAGLRTTKMRLKSFEDQYHLQTSAFLLKYENDEFMESTDFENWIGESRLLERLHEKIATLRGIRFEN